MQYLEGFLVCQPNMDKESSFKRAEAKVLLIEDDKLIQIVHKELLIKLGCQVALVSSGEEALLVIENHYDLILLDIGLPGISGITVAEKFRSHENHKKTRIIAVTAHSSAITNNLCFYPGIEKVLNKPVSMEDLARVIY